MMALHPVIAGFLFIVIGSLFSGTLAATCKIRSTCTKSRSSQERQGFTCGSWWSRRTCYRSVTRYYLDNEACDKYVSCVHCQWSDWNRVYGQCSVTCGGGTQTVTETRKQTVAARNGGNACTGGNYRSFTQSCNTNPCPVNCKWTEWGAATYNDCPVTCGGGIQTGYQLRSVQIQAKYGGKPCTGGERKDISRGCNPHPCPIDGGWSEYSEFTTWSECSGECDQSRQRERSCTNPKPQYGGRDCDGEAVDVQVRDCYEGQCLVESCKSQKKSNEMHASLPRNCKQYVVCSHTNTVMDCGKGTHWNQKKLTCDHEDVAGCKDDNEPEDESERCVDGEYFTENGDLTVFFMCENGKKSNPIHCPYGLIFNPVINNCDWPTS